jgi:hypothetical protein
VISIPKTLPPLGNRLICSPISLDFLKSKIEPAKIGPAGLQLEVHANAYCPPDEAWIVLGKQCGCEICWAKGVVREWLGKTVESA